MQNEPMQTETDNDAAVRWAVRRDAGPLSATEQAELDAWLAEKDSREGALLRAEATLAYLDRGRALGPLTENAPAPRVSRRMIMTSGLAAAAAVGGVAILSNNAERIRTKVGEVRRLPLADGSVATVNTDSRLAVLVEPDKRLVQLDAGEAWFQVAHDTTRPFIVEAGDVRVRAVGTAFSVRKHDKGADVLVTEGAVETWVVGREQDRARIAAGAKTVVETKKTQIAVVQAPDDVDRALAWRNGELALNGETLGYAVAEINRYNKIQLSVDDPKLAAAPLVGYFRTNEPENFGCAVASMLGARVERKDAEIIISR